MLVENLVAGALRRNQFTKWRHVPDRCSSPVPDTSSTVSLMDSHVVLFLSDEMLELSAVVTTATVAPDSRSWTFDLAVDEKKSRFRPSPILHFKRHHWDLWTSSVAPGLCCPEKCLSPDSPVLIPVPSPSPLPLNFQNCSTLSSLILSFWHLNRTKWSSVTPRGDANETEAQNFVNAHNYQLLHW